MPCPEMLALTTYRVPAAIAVLGPTLAAANHSFGHDADAGSPQLGKVTFPVSGNTAAQREFQVAMAYYHSFAWPEIDTGWRLASR